MAPPVEASGRPASGARGPYVLEELDGGILRVAVHGALDADQARSLLDDAQAAILRMKEPLRVLADSRRSGRHTREARRLLANHFIQHPPSYLAQVGGTWRHRLLLRIAIRGTLVRKVRHFDDEAEALAWLRRI